MAQRSLTIGLVYELLGSRPRRPGDPADADAEYEPEETVAALESAIRAEGHRPVRLGGPEALLASIGKGELPCLDLDAVWNIAEGYGSRNREAFAPVLLEMAGVPTLGSDALSLSLSLDKLWTRQLVAAAGVPVPPGASVASAEEARHLDISADISASYPLFVKPRWEGTAKGIGPQSKVADRASLVAAVGRIVQDYAQPALVEAFLPGAEYTVTLVGNAPPSVLPALQRALEADTGIGVHALGAESDWQPVTPGELSPALEAQLGALALRAFEALACLDFARADFRLDRHGVPHFLEINPLPTFAPDGSFGILAELEGRPLATLLGEVLRGGLSRLGLV